MKDFKKICLFLLSAYLVLGLVWIGKDLTIHYLRRDGIPVLGYHGVVEDELKNTKYKDNPYYMSVSEFDKQMKYLYDHHYTAYSMDDIYNYYNGKLDVVDHSVCLTFDDGYSNFNDVVKPILEKYNLKATCFVIGNKAKKNNKKYLGVEDLKNDEYVEYYSHSYDLHHFAYIHHLKLIETLSVDEIRNDFEMNKDIVSTDYFAYPYGVSSKNAMTYLESSDVLLAFSYNQNKHMTRDDNRYYLPRYLMFSSMPMFMFEFYVD